MTLPVSGTISMSQIQTEFGGANPISFSEYYRGGAYTTSNNTSVPTSGTLSMSQFYSTVQKFVFAITTNTTDANLRTLAVNAGWNQSNEVEATINSGVTCGASTTGVYGLTINGSFPSGVTLINNGFILGCGGKGGDAAAGATNQGGNATPGLVGGPGLLASVAVTIYNYGTIGGGGGGGGGGRGYNTAT